MNRGKNKLSLGAPLVMKRVVGRGPRQGILVVHDALLFHEARRFCSAGRGRKGGLGPRGRRANGACTFRRASLPGQGTGNFVVRFFTGSYYAGAIGWPGMYGKGFDETLSPLLPGPVARAAEQGFVTAFLGNNFTVMPNFGNVGWDVGFNSERHDHPAAMARIMERWADASVRTTTRSRLVECHHPCAGSRRAAGPGAADAARASDRRGQHGTVRGLWPNLLDGADHLKRPTTP